jgi:hypothetical protein
MKQGAGHLQTEAGIFLLATQFKVRSAWAFKEFHPTRLFLGWSFILTSLITVYR